MHDDTHSVPDTGDEIRLEEEVSDTDPSLAIQKLDRLRQELKTAKDERDEYLAGWQRAKADFVNTRKELLASTKDIEKEIARRVLEDFLPILDTFSLARGNTEAWEKVDANWRQGIEHIERMFVETLSAHGLTPFGEIGEHFNPEKYHAVATVLVDDPEKDHTVIEVLKPGYSMAGQVIRPAEVKVGAYERKE
jgi:molecular chaperone GrpE